MVAELRKQGSVLLDQPRTPGQDLKQFDLGNAFEEKRHIFGRKALTRSSFRLQMVVQLLWALGLAGATLLSNADALFGNSGPGLP